jgi:hypothetical protein
MLVSKTILQFNHYNFNEEHYSNHFVNYSFFDLLDIYQSNDDYVFFNQKGFFYKIQNLKKCKTEPNNNLNGDIYFYNKDRLMKMNDLLKVPIFHISPNSHNNFLIDFDKLDDEIISKNYKQEQIVNIIKKPIVSKSNDIITDEFEILEGVDSYGYDYCYLQNDNTTELIKYCKELCKNNKNIIGFNSLGYLKYYIEPNRDKFIQQKCSLYIHKSNYKEQKDIINVDDKKIHIRYFNDNIGLSDEYNTIEYNKEFIDDKFVYQDILNIEKYNYNLITDGTKIPGFIFEKSVIFKTNSINQTKHFFNQVYSVNSKKFKFIFDTNSYLNMFIKKTNYISNISKNNYKSSLLLICVHESYIQHFRNLIDLLINHFVIDKIKVELFVFKDNYFMDDNYSKIKEKIQDTQFVLFLDIKETNYVSNIVYECIYAKCCILYSGCNEVSLLFNNYQSFIPVEFDYNILKTEYIYKLINKEHYDELLEKNEFDKTIARINEYNVFNKFQKYIKFEQSYKNISKPLSDNFISIICIKNIENFNKKYYEYVFNELQELNKTDKVYIFVEDISEEFNQKLKSIIYDLNVMVINVKENIYEKMYDFVFYIKDTPILYIENNNFELYQNYNDMFDEFDLLMTRVKKLNRFDKFKIQSNYYITNEHNSPSTLFYCNSDILHYIDPLNCNSGKDFIIRKMIY